MNKQFGTITLMVAVDTIQEFEQFKSTYSHEALRANLTLTTDDNKETQVEVLDVFETSWSDPEEL